MRECFVRLRAALRLRRRTDVAALLTAALPHLENLVRKSPESALYRLDLTYALFQLGRDQRAIPLPTGARCRAFGGAAKNRNLFSAPDRAAQAYPFPLLAGCGAIDKRRHMHQNRDRLLTTGMSRKVMAAILAHREVAPLLSDDHFSVDGTLIAAWTSMKSFRPKAEGAPPDGAGPDDPPTLIPPLKTNPHDPNPRPRPDRCPAPITATATPQSTSKARSVQTRPTLRPWTRRHGSTRDHLAPVRSGCSGRRAALDMVHRYSPGSTKRLTLGADKGYDAAGFVSYPGDVCVTPHVAHKSRHSAIDGRTTRHQGCALWITPKAD